MGVSVRKRRDDSTGAWWVFISHHGRRRAKRVGDKKAALVAASQLRARLTLGDLSVFDQPAVPAPSFEMVARRWLIEYPALHPIRPATLSNYRQFIEGHLIPFFGPKPISELTVSQVEQFITAKRQPGGSIRNPARPLQDRAIHVGLVALRLILKRATRDKLIPANPMVDLEWRGAARTDRVDPFTGPELRLILAAARQVDPALAVMLQVWMQCGARAGEIAGLQWADLDLAHGLLTIQRTYSRHRLGPTKTGKNRTVSFLHPILDDGGEWRPGSSTLAFEVLGQLRQRVEQAGAGPFVFGQAGKPLRSGQLHRLWRRTLMLAKVRYREPEQLRHTLASTLLSRGAPLLYVQSVGGWRSAAVLLRAYARWLPGGESATQVQPAHLVESIPEWDRLGPVGVSGQDNGPEKEPTHAHPNHVLRRVKLPTPGLQFAGRHQG
jgi:integrase